MDDDRAIGGDAGGPGWAPAVLEMDRTGDVAVVPFVIEPDVDDRCSVSSLDLLPQLRWGHRTDPFGRKSRPDPGLHSTPKVSAKVVEPDPDQLADGLPEVPRTIRDEHERRCIWNQPARPCREPPAQGNPVRTGDMARHELARGADVEDGAASIGPILHLPRREGRGLRNSAQHLRPATIDGPQFSKVRGIRRKPLESPSDELVFRLWLA